VLVSNILSAGQYQTSQQVSAAIAAFGYITSANASVLTEAILSVGQFMTSQETSVAIAAFGFTTSASVSTMILAETSGFLSSASASSMYAYRGFGAVSASNSRVSASGQYQVLNLLGDGTNIITSASGNTIKVKYAGVAGGGTSTVAFHGRSIFVSVNTSVDSPFRFEKIFTDTVGFPLIAYVPETFVISSLGIVFGSCFRENTMVSVSNTTYVLAVAENMGKGTRTELAGGATYRASGNASVWVSVAGTVTAGSMLLLTFTSAGTIGLSQAVGSFYWSLKGTK